MWDLSKHRLIPYTGYGEFWLDRPITYHPDVRFILAQTYSIYWIWRILTGQTYYIPPRGEIYLSTDLFIYWIWWILTGQTCYISPRSEIYLGTELFHTLDMTNFEWTDLFLATQRWDIFKYRLIPYTGWDEFWLDRLITYHPDVRFL